MSRPEALLQRNAGIVLFVIGVCQGLAAVLERLSPEGVGVVVCADGMIVMGVLVRRLRGPVKIGTQGIELLLAVAKQTETLPPRERRRALLELLGMLTGRRAVPELAELAALTALDTRPLEHEDIARYVAEVEPVR